MRWFVASFRAFELNEHLEEVLVPFGYTNGLIRQYFPKGSSLEDVTVEQIMAAQDKLNHRPRKILGFKTPYEVFYGKISQVS